MTTVYVGQLDNRRVSRSALVALAAILALGLGLRINEAWDGRDPVFDAAAYATIAANLERGEGFTLGPRATQPASNYSPGLPLLVAGLYELTGGAHERAARLLLALVGALAALFAYLIGRRLAGPIAGLVGAGAVAVYPALIEYQGMLMGEPLAATLLSGAVLGVLWAADPGSRGSARGSCRGGPPPRAQAPLRGAFRRGGPPTPRHPRERWRWLIPGILFGALALVRPEYLGVALLVSLVVLGTGWWDDRRGSVADAAILLVGAAIVVAPWTVRNAVVMDRFVPVSTGGGQVLFAGTYLPSDGDPERVGAEVVKSNPELFGPGALERLRLEQILARLAAARQPGVETDRALARMGREQLRDGVTEEPLRYTGFVARKVGRVWAHGPRAVMREPGWELLHWALVALAAVGLVALAARRRWEALLLATVLLAVTAVCALLVASPRRTLVTIPLVAALAGAVDVPLSRGRKGPPRNGTSGRG